MKSILAATTALLLISAPGMAQVAPDMGPRAPVGTTDPEKDTPETLGAGRQMEGPAGDALARPADPTRQPQTPSIGDTPERDEEDDDTAATNVIPPPGTAPAGVQPLPPAQQRTETPRVPEGQTSVYDPDPPPSGPLASPIGTVGGAMPPEGQTISDRLSGMTVHLADRKDFGEVEHVYVDKETGDIKTVIVSAGGQLGIGDIRYGVPWERVANLDQNAEEMTIGATMAELQYDEPPQLEDTQLPEQSESGR